MAGVATWEAVGSYVWKALQFWMFEDLACQDRLLNLKLQFDVLWNRSGKGIMIINNAQTGVFTDTVTCWMTVLILFAANLESLCYIEVSVL